MTIILHTCHFQTSYQNPEMGALYLGIEIIEYITFANYVKFDGHNLHFLTGLWLQTPWQASRQV